LPSAAVRVKALVLAMALALVSPGWGLADPATPPATPPAAPTYGEYQSDLAAEARIAAAIAAADAAMVRAQHDLDNLRAEVAATQDRLRSLDSRVSDLNGQLAAERGRVAAVVRFLYEDGSTSFLAVLLQASTFGDFLTRFALVAQIVRAEVDVLRQVAALRADLARERAAAAAANARLQSETAAQAATLARLQQDQVARTQALAQARQQAGAAAAKLAALDQTLLQGLPQLDAVLAGWSSLPWDSVQPDSVSVDLAAGHVAVTLSAAALTAAAGIAPLSLTVAPDGVSLTSGPPAMLQLSGPVSVQGNALLWQPDRLAVGGAPAGPGVVTALLGGRRLIIPVPPPAPGLSLKSVRLKAGALELDFGL
jgi:hypothetical protein